MFKKLQNYIYLGVSVLFVIGGAILLSVVMNIAIGVLLIAFGSCGLGASTVLVVGQLLSCPTTKKEKPVDVIASDIIEDTSQPVLDEAAVDEILADIEVPDTAKIANEFNLKLKDFQDALQKNQFILNYQPKLSITNGAFVGLEALIRWNHPKHGVISPMKFLAVAEALCIIDQIDNWVIDRACSDVASWSKQVQRVLPISLNFSEGAILDSNFLPTLIKSCQKHGVGHNFIQIEISEQTFLSHTDYCKSLIKVLQSNEFYVIIENLSVHYMNIENLKGIKCDQFTFDREVIQAITTDIRKKHIVEQIIKLAGDNNISVLCEGIETPAQLDLLKEIGCALAKGYYIARPMEGHDAMEYMV